ncbi:hypothetical protein VTJ83DRAFT_4535 [Remersonia thermophila]|uniref:Uncharacterized protein n=1 Tax=Remersonia thermophila TaxID=72144 RepID=A0ABR4DA88_9PEZI
MEGEMELDPEAPLLLSDVSSSLIPVEDAVHYALRNELTVDSLQLGRQALVVHHQAIASTLDSLSPDELMKGAGLHECLFRPIIPAAEPWPMPASALKFLHQVCTRSTKAEVADLTLRQCFATTATGMEALRSTKMELPALRSDHDADCRALQRRVEALRKVSLPDHRLPLHPVHAESGEGLEFPQSMLQKDADQMRAIERERLEVDKDAMFPMREPMENPFAPEPDACEVPEPSEPSSRLGEDIEAAEDRVLAPDRQFWADVMETDQPPERHSDMDVSEMFRAGDFRVTMETSSPPHVPRNIKLDTPLLPCGDEENGVEVVRVLDPGDLVQAKRLVMSSDASSGSDGPTGQLVALFKTSETAVMRQAEQEKLEPLDATARVTVPILDFSVSVPEWEQRICDPEAMFRRIQQHLDVSWQGSKWPHNRAAEQNMVWVPLAHMGEKRPAWETIEAEPALLESFLRGPRDDEILTSADYVYKKPGPAILRVDDEDDDEGSLTGPSFDEPSSGSNTASSGQPSGSTGSLSEQLQSSPDHRSKPRIPEPADLTTLVARRKRQIDEMVGRGPSNKGQVGAAASSGNALAEGYIDAALIPSTNVLRGYMTEFTDFAPLVENFVEMNFPKKPKLTHSSYFNPRGDAGPWPALSKAEMAAKLMPPPPKPVLALAPEIMPSEIPPRIVISTTVSNIITQHLKKFLPGIVLLTRDYNRHRPPGWQPGTSPPNLDEADIVISPSTGLLLTTMIHLRQRALPKQRAASGEGPGSNTDDSLPTFHRIVCNVAARHERLIVLVSEGSKHSETVSPLSQSDVRALAELQGLAAGLRVAVRTDVQVVYVGGGAETLARWAAFYTCLHQHRWTEEGEDGGMGVGDMLLPLETTWEVFLRRAGMNAYAAQAVLGRLKVPDGRPAVGGRDGRAFGLPLFVAMSREERVEMFEDMLGGRRVLERVSDVLDQRWGQSQQINKLGMARGW